MINPHGNFDLERNRGHINIGLSHDTTQFACDSLQWHWNRIGQQCYPEADSILLLTDCDASAVVSNKRLDCSARLHKLHLEMTDEGNASVEMPPEGRVRLEAERRQ